MENKLQNDSRFKTLYDSMKGQLNIVKNINDTMKKIDKLIELINDDDLTKEKYGENILQKFIDTTDIYNIEIIKFNIEPKEPIVVEGKGLK